MTRTYLIFGDIEGKLDVLNVECTKCARKPLHQQHRRRVAQFLKKAAHNRAALIGRPDSANP